MGLTLSTLLLQIFTFPPGKLVLAGGGSRQKAGIEMLN